MNRLINFLIRKVFVGLTAPLLALLIAVPAHADSRDDQFVQQMKQIGISTIANFCPYTTDPRVYHPLYRPPGYQNWSILESKRHVGSSLGQRS